MGKRIERYLDGSWQHMLPNAMGKKATVVLKNAESYHGKLKEIIEMSLVLATRNSKTILINLEDIFEIHLEVKAAY